MTTITWNNSSWFNNPYLIGFENVFPKFNEIIKSNEGSFPPYNLKKVDEETSVLELAVAGFSKNEITVTEEDGKLTISGEKAENDGEYVYKGIATRKFTRTYVLSEYVTVSVAELADGMLYIVLKKFIPEGKKARNIEIVTEQPKKAVKKEYQYKRDDWYKEPIQKSIN